MAIRFPISALDYGNGDKVQYSYDDKGRVLSAASKYGDKIEDAVAWYFFGENNKRKVDGLADVKSGVENITTGFSILLMPDPTIANDLAAIGKITYGILEATGGVTKIIVGFIKDER